MKCRDTGYGCLGVASFTVNLRDVTEKRLGLCEWCAVRHDDAGSIATGSAIRLFPKEVKR